MDERTFPSDEWVLAANRLATIAHQLSSVAHEANNLLQVIAGSAEMIDFSAEKPEAVRRRAAMIAEHAHRVSGLLTAVQELARIPERDARNSVPLQAVVAGALELRRHALTRAHVPVDLRMPEETLYADASWGGVTQVLLNLLTNAEQALEGREHGRIAVELERADGTAVLRVTDNAGGYEPAAVQVGQLSKTAAGMPRLGIGLAAAIAIAASVGGSLTAASNPSGTTATLRLRAF